MPRLFQKLLGPKPHEAPAAVGAYQPLPKGEYVRHLKLEPGRDEQPLVCTLHVVRLREMRSTEAISYAWGGDRRDREITCNGETLYITPNLQRVLRRLRLHQEPRTLWADSICINQNDLAERGAQVALMGRIYSKAKRVLIYLGGDHDGLASIAASFLAELDAMVLEGFSHPMSGTNTYPHLEEAERERLLADPRWPALLAITQQPWFQRGWVVQEAGLAYEAILIWGEAEMDWRSVTRVWVWMSQRLHQVKLRYPRSDLMNGAHLTLYHSRHPIEIKTLYHASYKPDLDFLGLMHTCRQLQFKDPSDRVYALLAFADKARLYLLDLRVDYQKSKEQVYLELAREHIRLKRDTELLHYVQHDEATIHAEFPSWVPCWDHLIYHAIVFHTTLNTFKSASSKSSSQMHPVLGDHDILQVRGVLFDPLVFTSTLFSRPVSFDDVRALWQTVRALPTVSPYPASHQAVAFLQALGLNRMQSPWSYALQCRELYIHSLHGRGLQSERERVDHQFFHEWIQSCVHNRRFVVTQRGYYGLAPRPVTDTDMPGVIFGMRSCAFLRPQSSQPDGFRYLGDGVLVSKTVFAVREQDGGGEIMFSFGLPGGGLDWAEWAGVADQDISLC